MSKFKLGKGAKFCDVNYIASLSNSCFTWEKRDNTATLPCATINIASTVYNNMKLIYGNSILKFNVFSKPLFSSQIKANNQTTREYQAHETSK